MTLTPSVAFVSCGTRHLRHASETTLNITHIDSYLIQTISVSLCATCYKAARTSMAFRVIFPRQGWPLNVCKLSDGMTK